MINIMSGGYADRTESSTTYTHGLVRLCTASWFHNVPRRHWRSGRVSCLSSRGRPPLNTVRPQQSWACPRPCPVWLEMSRARQMSRPSRARSGTSSPDCSSCHGRVCCARDPSPTTRSSSRRATGTRRSAAARLSSPRRLRRACRAGACSSASPTRAARACSRRVRVCSRCSARPGAGGTSVGRPPWRICSASDRHCSKRAPSAIPSSPPACRGARPVGSASGSPGCRRGLGLAPWT